MEAETVTKNAIYKLYNTIAFWGQVKTLIDSFWGFKLQMINNKSILKCPSSINNFFLDRWHFLSAESSSLSETAASLAETATAKTASVPMADCPWHLLRNTLAVLFRHRVTHLLGNLDWNLSEKKTNLFWKVM